MLLQRIRDEVLLRHGCFALIKMFKPGDLVLRMKTPPCRILWTGNLQQVQVVVEWSPQPFLLPPELAAAIDMEWSSRAQEGYFNGALARLQRWLGDEQQLTLWLQPSDYKTLLYSNRHVAQIKARWGEGLLSRALGISAVVACADGQLVLMKRSQRVGEFPGAFDVFGGHIDMPQDGRSPDLFAAIGQELEEEAHLFRTEYEIYCIGLLQTCAAFKPELVFAVKYFSDSARLLSCSQTAKDRREYDQLFTLPCQETAIALFLTEQGENISPSAFGCLQIYKDYLKRNIKEKNYATR